MDSSRYQFRCQHVPPGRDHCAFAFVFSDKHSVLFGCGRMVQALGATSNVMALLLVNMIGYAAGIQKTGRVADGIFINREGIVAAGCGFAFVFSGVQASPNASCSYFFSHTLDCPQIAVADFLQVSVRFCGRRRRRLESASIKNMHAVSGEAVRARTSKGRYCHCYTI